MSWEEHITHVLYPLTDWLRLENSFRQMIKLTCLQVQLCCDWEPLPPPSPPLPTLPYNLQLAAFMFEALQASSKIIRKNEYHIHSRKRFHVSFTNKETRYWQVFFLAKWESSLRFLLIVFTNSCIFGAIRWKGVIVLRSLRWHKEQPGGNKIYSRSN